MSVTASSPAPAANGASQKTARTFVKKPSQDEKNETLKEIEANMEKIRPRLVSRRPLIRQWLAETAGTAEESKELFSLCSLYMGSLLGTLDLLLELCIGHNSGSKGCCMVRHASI